MPGVAEHAAQQFPAAGPELVRGYVRRVVRARRAGEHDAAARLDDPVGPGSPARVTTARGESIEAGLVVGADGIHSLEVVRRSARLRRAVSLAAPPAVALRSAFVATADRLGARLALRAFDGIADWRPPAPTYAAVGGTTPPADGGDPARNRGEHR
ncbi:hypothetical protein ACFYYR_14165 [Streptomyces sp. NPDC001922]|uniref:hypothetical protein n=1 Tax=Streptomyces sp. NPDC001922 TaxID=3364624 RepID=UPI0036D1960E